MNASAVDDHVMVEIHTVQLFEIFDRLEVKVGIQPALIAARADFMDDHAEGKKLHAGLPLPLAVQPLPDVEAGQALLGA